MLTGNTLILTTPSAAPYAAGLAHVVGAAGRSAFIAVSGGKSSASLANDSYIEFPEFSSHVWPFGVGKAFTARRLLRKHNIHTLHAVGAEAIRWALQLQPFCGCKVVADGLPETEAPLSKPLLKLLSRCHAVVSHKEHHTQALKPFTHVQMSTCAPAWFLPSTTAERPLNEPYRAAVYTLADAPEELFLYLRALNEAFHQNIEFEVFNAKDQETVKAAARQAHIAPERIRMYTAHPTEIAQALDHCHVMAIGNLGKNECVFPLTTWALSHGSVVILPALYKGAAAFVRQNEAGIVAEDLNPSVMRKATVQLYQALSVGFYDHALIQERMNTEVLEVTKAAYAAIYGSTH